MYSKQTISLKKILWRVMQHPLAADLNYDDAAMYAIEAIELIGTPLTLVKKETNPPIRINGYKGALPNDIVNIKSVLSVDSGTIMHYNTGNHDAANVDYQDYVNSKYTIEHGVIKTSFEKGDVIVSYDALPTDCDGYPLIPDDIKVKNAIRYYILYSHIEPLYDIGKITDKAFGRIEQQKLWYMGAAQSSTQLHNMDHAQAMVNSINRLIINDHARHDFYQTLGDRETIKKL